jgi:hypothetical protein
VLGITIKLRNMHHITQLTSLFYLMHIGSMRTTITLDDNTHEFAAYYARARGITLSAAIDELIRKAQVAPRPKLDIRKGADGIPMFPPTGRVITSEKVRELEEEEFDPEKFA